MADDPQSDLEEQLKQLLGVLSVTHQVYSKTEVLGLRDAPESHLADCVDPQLAARHIIRIPGSGVNISRVPGSGDWPRKKEESKTIVRAQPSLEEVQIQQAAKQTSARIAAQKDEEELLARDVKVTLNKLCAANLPRLLQKLFDSARSQERGSELLTSGIFDKACSEIKFTQLYAELCQRLEGLFREQNLVVTNSHGHPISLFKKAILKKCQTLFESATEGVEADKAKVLGNVRFIGELYRVRLLGPKVVLECIRDLIDVQLRTLKRFAVSELRLSEDRLEGVCMLLPLVTEAVELRPQVESLIALLGNIRDKRGDLSVRIKFLLLVPLT